MKNTAKKTVEFKVMTYEEVMDCMIIDGYFKTHPKQPHLITMANDFATTALLELLPKKYQNMIDKEIINFLRMTEMQALLLDYCNDHRIYLDKKTIPKN